MHFRAGRKEGGERERKNITPTTVANLMPCMVGDFLAWLSLILSFPVFIMNHDRARNRNCFSPD